MKDNLSREEFEELFKDKLTPSQLTSLAYLFKQGVLKLFNGDSFKYNEHGHYFGRPDNFDINPNHPQRPGLTNKRNTFYTGEHSVAFEYASTMSDRSGRVDMDVIVSEDDKALIFDSYLIGQLVKNPQTRQKVLRAMSALSQTQTLEDLNIPFDKRQLGFDILDFLNAYTKNRTKLVSQEVGAKVAEHIHYLSTTYKGESEAEIGSDLVRLVYEPELDNAYSLFAKLQSNSPKRDMDTRETGEFFQSIAHSYNTQIIIDTIPELYVGLINSYLGNGVDNKAVRGFPDFMLKINDDYVASWLERLNVVGVLKTFSETSNKTRFKCDLFNLDRLHTKAKVGKTYASLLNQYGAFSKLVEPMSDLTKDRLLTKSPKNTMDTLLSDKRFLGVAKYFEASAGVWEGFTIGQHTESVLKFFDDNFSDVISMSPAIKQIMHAAIIVHDSTKGIHGRYASEELKLKVAENLLLNIDKDLPKEYVDIVCFIAFDSQKHTSDYYVNGDPYALDELNESCKNVLKNSTNREPSPSEVLGLASLCRVMQTCDSGAYTKFAKTRIRETDGDKYFSNLNLLWSDSFVKSRHGYRFKKDIDGSKELI